MTPTSDEIVSRLRRDYRRVSFAPRDFLPPKLCHYTSAAGVLGILETGTLRGSNFAYLNDASEIQFGNTLVREVLGLYVERADGRSRQLLDVTVKAMQEISSQIEFYLTCFCTQPDLLSQWRGYGSSSGRYCIVFDPEELHNGTESLSPVYFGGVEYEREDQINKIEPVLDRALEAIQEMMELKPGDQKACAKGICNEVFQKLVREMCFLKHPGFREEHEWRAVHWLQDLSNVDFESRSGAIRPFVSLFAGSGDPPRLPIRQIIVGSSPVAAQSRKSVELLLEKRGYTGVDVTESGLPYRDV